MKITQKIRIAVYSTAFVLLLSLTLSLSAFGAEPSGLSPGDRQQLEQSTRESGERITDVPTRNETLNEIHAGPSTPPPAVSAPPPPSSGSGLSPLPPLSTGGKF